MPGICDQNKTMSEKRTMAGGERTNVCVRGCPVRARDEILETLRFRTQRIAHAELPQVRTYPRCKVVYPGDRTASAR